MGRATRLLPRRTRTSEPRSPRRRPRRRRPIRLIALDYAHAPNPLGEHFRHLDAVCPTTCRRGPRQWCHGTAAAAPAAARSPTTTSSGHFSLPALGAVADFPTFVSVERDVVHRHLVAPVAPHAPDCFESHGLTCTAGGCEVGALPGMSTSGRAPGTPSVIASGGRGNLVRRHLRDVL